MPDDAGSLPAAASARCDVGAEHPALIYARALLRDLAITPRAALRVHDEHPALSWARSGVMALTGMREALMCPSPVAACADGALAALASLSPSATAFADLRGATLLSERAALRGLARRGAQSAGGRCRLLACADATLAVNLARAEDWDLLPAWLEAPVSDWAALRRELAWRSADELLTRARLLGLAVARSAPVDAARPWCDEVAQGSRRARALDRPVRVVDLSSLWAGPLCGQLLRRLGAEVVKVESLARPDGARQGPAAFFDRINHGKASVALDFRTPLGRRQLAALLDRADIVIEASRPRALRQLGIDAEARVRQRPGLSWISITGYGRREPEAQWIAYGDDAGVAGGLSALLDEASGQRVFCGDAIADPLTGLHAALAAWAAHVNGGGRLLSLALRDVAARVANFDRPRERAALRQRQADWQARAAGQVLPPAVPERVGRARALGADTARVLRDWDIAC